MEKLRSRSTAMAHVVMGYQSAAQASRPYGKHSLLSAHQRGSSPLTQSMMGFRKSHLPHTGSPHASSWQTVGVMNAIFLRFYTMAKQTCIFLLVIFPAPILNPSCIHPQSVSCGKTTFNICFSSFEMQKKKKLEVCLIGWLRLSLCCLSTV